MSSIAAPVSVPEPSAEVSTEPTLLRSLLVIASVGAAAIHFAFAPAHLDEQFSHGAFFLVIAWLQLGWAFAIYRKPSPLVYRAGIVLNLGILAVWILSRTVGINGEVEPFGLADSVAGALEAFIVLGSFAPVRMRAEKVGMPDLYRGVVLGGTAMAVAALVSASMTPSLSGHSHGEEGHSHGTSEVADGHTHSGTAADSAAQAAQGHTHGDTVAAVPFDPTKAVDLGGTPGVSAKEQADAEAIVERTLEGLPQWADQKVAEAAGFKTIGDGFTGTEHLMNQDNMSDEETFNPDKPESLVYDVDRKTGKKTLAAAMYMLKRGSPMSKVPKTGGKLMQWHIHNNLCYNAEGRVSGLTKADGTCPAGLVLPEETPMIHVWIRPNECGPFAALEGVGAGATANGEERLCDAAHGSHS